MFYTLNCIFYCFLYFNASYCTLLQINCCTILFTRNACAYTYFSIFFAFCVLLQLYISRKCIRMRRLLIMQVTTSCNNKVLQEVKYRMSFKWNTRNVCNMKNMHICINIRRLFMTFSWFIINVCNIRVRVTQNLSLVMLPMLLVNKLLQKDPGIAYRNIMAVFIFSFVWKNFFLSLSTSYFSNLNKKKKERKQHVSGMFSC